MSMPHKVMQTDSGQGILWRTRHDESCELCERRTHIGVGDNGDDYPDAWLCIRCILNHLVRALE